MSSVWLMCAAVVGGVWGHLYRKYGYSGSTLMILMFVFIGGFMSGMNFGDNYLTGIIDGIFELFWSWYGVGILAFVFVSETVGWFLNENPVRLNRKEPEPFVPGYSRPEPSYKHDYILFLLWREMGGMSRPKRSAQLRTPPPKPKPLPELKVPAILREAFKPFLTASNRKAIEDLMKYLPVGAIGRGHGIPIWKYLELRYTGTKDEQDIADLMSRIGTKSGFFKTELPVRIPEELRTQHHHIVAGTGAGKSQCIQQMVIEDLQSDCAIVVIDSQGDLVNKLATRVPTDRLILIDPQHCPPAIDFFNSEQDVASATELYEYIFSALDARMTSKQALCYRFVSRLLLNVPQANIQTFREVLEPGTAHQEHAIGLGETVEAFFRNEYNSRQFGETRAEILRRLYTVLENDTFAQMLSARESNLDITRALDDGKVILINTSKSYLKQTAASLFGRFFIAQVMQSVTARQNQRRRTYLYIDEFQDYAEDSHVLFTLFEQARKYELGLIVAHQYLGQLPTQLQQSIASNTAIKFAKNVSPDDARKLANQMRVRPEFIDEMPEGAFSAEFRTCGCAAYGVEFGKLEQTREVTSLSSVRKMMRHLYGVHDTAAPTTQPQRHGEHGPDSPMD